MRTEPRVPAIAPASSIPLLDASALPATDDWTLVESIEGMAIGNDFEPDFDRFGNVRLSASYDE